MKLWLRQIRVSALWHTTTFDQKQRRSPNRPKFAIALYLLFKEYLLCLTKH
ncbi:hypothetical protein [Nodularia chucula]|uniref:hypothetical protein n=1 Tax=Nodularia chucula TaxID=3093667 RepID=UPI0039C67CCF